MTNKLEPLQTTVTKECKDILKEQKKLQRKTIGLIIEELVLKEYQPLKDRLKNLED